MTDHVMSRAQLESLDAFLDAAKDIVDCAPDIAAVVPDPVVRLAIVLAGKVLSNLLEAIDNRVEARISEMDPVPVTG